MSEAIEPDTDGDVRYPDVTVRLTGVDSNAFAILYAVTSGLKKAGVPTAEQDAFRTEAMSGSYDELIQTAMRWVVVK